MALSTINGVFSS